MAETLAKAIAQNMAGAVAKKSETVDSLCKFVGDLKESGFPGWEKFLLLLKDREGWSDSHFTRRQRELTS